MKRKQPLQQFLDRHRLSQSDLAAALGVSRETVNRWVGGHTLPVANNLLNLLAFAKALESKTEVRDLFQGSSASKVSVERNRSATEGFGDACAVCRVPWDTATEHLPVALLFPALGGHPVGDLCESCARNVADLGWEGMGREEATS